MVADNDQNKPDRYRSDLSRAKGLGPAGHGLSHWWLQRVTALALVPLSLWLMGSLLSAMMFPTPEMVAGWLASPINAIALGLLIVALFAHSYLGLREIVEDYVKGPFKKYALVIGAKYLNIILAVICVLSIMRLHFIDTGINF